METTENSSNLYTTDVVNWVFRLKENVSSQVNICILDVTHTRKKTFLPGIEGSLEVFLSVRFILILTERDYNINRRISE